MHETNSDDFCDLVRCMLCFVTTTVKTSVEEKEKYYVVLNRVKEI